MPDYTNEPPERSGKRGWKDRFEDLRDVNPQYLKRRFKNGLKILLGTAVVGYIAFYDYFKNKHLDKVQENIEERYQNKQDLKEFHKGVQKDVDIWKRASELIKPGMSEEEKDSIMNGLIDGSISEDIRHASPIKGEFITNKNETLAYEVTPQNEPGKDNTAVVSFTKKSSNTPSLG